MSIEIRFDGDMSKISLLLFLNVISVLENASNKQSFRFESACLGFCIVVVKKGFLATICI